MQDMSPGAGLAALAFWGFVAICVVAGIWGTIRKRQIQHQTLRHALDRGEALDPDVVRRILADGRERLDRDLMLGGLILAGIAPGLAILGGFLSYVSPAALMPLIGVAGLVACLSIGMIAAARWLKRTESHDDLGPDF